jgi:NitT/TauT family transport system ATP-binding protein
MPDAGAPALLEVRITGKARMRQGVRVEIIKDLAFDLPRGEVTCLIGPSGCGKTTALRIVMGLDTAFEGRILPPSSGLRIGAVFQDPRLLPWRTVEQNVRLAAPRLSDAALAQLLEELGLSDWRRSTPHQLSLGMARRVALARALSVEPELLVLDEAFVSLDERSAEILRTVVFDAVERRRTTVLTVTHSVREALRNSDRILVLAPRPTHVLDTVVLSAARGARSAIWLTEQRAKLLALAPAFLEQE